MLHVTKKHTGKMNGMISLSTSTRDNPFCQSMQKTDAICKKCFAKNCERMYGDRKMPLEERVVQSWKKNGDILSTEKNVSLLVNASYFRFHSFGELINKQHALNFFSICRQNPDTNFALWTKRPNLVEVERKPANMILIYSSPKINVVSELPEGFDKVFTVFETKYINDNNININCENSCISCRKCYTHNDITFINERMKRERLWDKK